MWVDLSISPTLSDLLLSLMWLAARLCHSREDDFKSPLETVLSSELIRSKFGLAVRNNRGVTRKIKIWLDWLPQTNKKLIILSILQEIKFESALFVDNNCYRNLKSGSLFFTLIWIGLSELFLGNRVDLSRLNHTPKHANPFAVLLIYEPNPLKNRNRTNNNNFVFA